jgi:hypothetical protein
MEAPVHVIDVAPPLVAATAAESLHNVSPLAEPLLPAPPDPTLIVSVVPHAMLKPEL